MLHGLHRVLRPRMGPITKFQHYNQNSEEVGIGYEGPGKGSIKEGGECLNRRLIWVKWRHKVFFKKD